MTNNKYKLWTKIIRNVLKLFRTPQNKLSTKNIWLYVQHVTMGYIMADNSIISYNDVVLGFPHYTTLYFFNALLNFKLDIWSLSFLLPSSIWGHHCHLFLWNMLNIYAYYSFTYIKKVKKYFKIKKQNQSINTCKIYYSLFLFFVI